MIVFWCSAAAEEEGVQLVRAQCMTLSISAGHVLTARLRLCTGAASHCALKVKAVMLQHLTQHSPLPARCLSEVQWAANFTPSCSLRALEIL